jgi:hypothetical protein
MTELLLALLSAVMQSFSPAVDAEAVLEVHLPPCACRAILSSACGMQQCCTTEGMHAAHLQACK